MANTDLVTVYRSADQDAADDATTARDLLRDAGIEAEVFGDDAPGVVEGSWEVRVPATDAASAEQLLAAANEQVEDHVDPSHSLDLVTIFRSEATSTAEIEAMSIRSVLDALDIPSVLVGTAALPSLAFEVRVPRTFEGQARTAIAEAQATGPAAADEASGQAMEPQD